MTKYRVKVTKEILEFFTRSNVQPRGRTVKEGDELFCHWNGDEYVWFWEGVFVFQTKSGDHYYWDKAFTDWLRKNHPEELI